MPIYVYQREDGTTFEVVQSIHDDALTIDRDTGQQVKRVLQPPTIVFHGSGFHNTDNEPGKTRSAQVGRRATKKARKKSKA